MFERFVVCRAVLILMLIVSSGLPAAARQDPLKGWKPVAQTRALSLTAVEESGGRFIFHFKNVSGRTITAFAVSFNSDRENTTNLFEDWFDSEQSGHAHGGEFQLSVLAEETAGSGKQIRISAVMFEDGAGEGSAYHLDSLRFRRFGHMLENERILAILSSKDSYAGAAGIAALAQKAGRLPDRPADAFASVERISLPGVSVGELRRAEEGVLAHFMQGVRNARFNLLRKVEDFRKLPAVSRDKEAAQADFISQLKKSYGEKSRRNHAFCERLKGGIR